MSDMAGKAAQVAVERSWTLPRYKADQLLPVNNQLPTTHFLIPNSSFLLFFLSAIFRAFMSSRSSLVIHHFSSSEKFRSESQAVR